MCGSSRAPLAFVDLVVLAVDLGLQHVSLDQALHDLLKREEETPSSSGLTHSALMPASL